MKKYLKSVPLAISGLVALPAMAFDTTAAEASIASAVTGATTVAVGMLGIAVVVGAIAIARRKGT